MDVDKWDKKFRFDATAHKSTQKPPALGGGFLLAIRRTRRTQVSY